MIGTLLKSNVCKDKSSSQERSRALGDRHADIIVCFGFERDDLVSTVNLEGPDHGLCGRIGR